MQFVGRGFNRVHIETTNEEVHQSIQIQEFIFLPPELVEVFKQFNTFYTSNFAEEDMTVRVPLISADLNRTAEYLETYGRDNMDSFAQAPEIYRKL